MYIDYGTMLNINNVLHSRESGDADSMNVPVDLPPEQNTTDDTDSKESCDNESEESCCNSNTKSEENEEKEENEEGWGGGTAAYASSEAYQQYLKRHANDLPPKSIFEMSKEELEDMEDQAEEKLNDVCKNGKVKPKEKKKKVEDKKIKKEDPPEVKALKEKHKKEAREEYLRRHSKDF